MMVDKSLSEILNDAGKTAETTQIPAQNLSVPFKIDGDAETQAALVDMINRIAVSKTGREVLETAAKAGFTLSMEFMLGANGGCAKESKKIVLNPLSKQEELIGVLIHESRHAGQFERGEYDASDENRPRTETLKTAIMRTRAVEADAQATAAQALCEMMDAGDVEPLRAFARAPHNATIAKAVDRALYDPESLNNGSLRTAAFLAWYDNTDVVELYDQYYQIDMMNRRAEKGLNGADTYAVSMSPAKIVADLCLDSEGKNYFTEDPAILGTGVYAAVTVKKTFAMHQAIEAAPNKKPHIENTVPFKDAPEIAPALIKRRQATR